MMISKANAEQYLWGKDCESWILQNSDNLIVKHEKMPSNTSEQEHFHKKAEQFFFILAGTATFSLNGKEFFLNENEGISVEPKMKHFIKNDSAKDLEFLVISTSSTENDRILV